MFPTLLQRLFIDDRPFFFLIGVGAITTMCWVGAILLPAMTWTAWDISRFIVLMPVAACLGIVLGALFGGLILGTVVLPIIERLNGGLFQTGDEVVILSKHFRGRVTRVYAVWAERGQLRVELGETERKKVNEVFGTTDVCRVPSSRIVDPIEESVSEG